MPDFGAINAVGALPGNVSGEFATSVQLIDPDTHLGAPDPRTNGRTGKALRRDRSTTHRPEIGDRGEQLVSSQNHAMRPTQGSADIYNTAPPPSKPAVRAIATGSLKATLSPRAEKFAGRPCRFR